MSAAIMCQLANGEQYRELMASEDKAIQKLRDAIERHEAKGRTVDRELSGRHHCTVREAGGAVIAAYWIESAI